MATININTIIQNAEQQISKLATSTLSSYSKQAIADGNTFLQSVKNDIQTYTQQLADGTIDQATFKTLMTNETNLAEMDALEQAGLAEAQIDNFTNEIGR